MTERADKGFPKFEKKNTLAATARVTKAGGNSLTAAVDLDPAVIHHGDEGYMVIHWKCVDVRHPAVKDVPTAVTRQHILETQTMRLVTPEFVPAKVYDMVETIMTEQRQRIEDSEPEPEEV